MKKIEAMRLPSNRAAALLDVAKRSPVYKHHNVRFHEEPGTKPNESKIVIEAESEVYAGLAQGFLITTLERLNKVN